MPNKKRSAREIKANTEARWSGALSALTKYLPHLILSCALGIAGWTHFEASNNRQDIDKVWQHSGNWRRDISDLQYAVWSNNVPRMIQDEAPSNTMP